MYQKMRPHLFFWTQCQRKTTQWGGGSEPNFRPFPPYNSFCHCSIQVSIRILEEIQKICKITRQNLKSYTFLDVFPVQCIQDQSLKIYQMTKAYTEVCWQFGISQWCEWNITLYFCIENNQTYKMTKIVLLRIFASLRNSTTVTKLT